MALSMARMLESYRISPKNGFALNEPSPTRFSNPQLQPWVELGSVIPALIQDGSLRAKVNSMPVLSPELMESIEEYRLAFVILTFLAQAYIWGNHEVDKPENHLPPSLSIPLLEISKELEIQPGFCYAGGSTWLYTKEANGAERCVCSFTGTKSEEHFNLTTHNVERIGGRALVEGLTAARLSAQRNEKGVIESLEKMAVVLQECKVALKDMRNGCEPDVFYFKLRPYLVGSQSIEGGIYYRTEDSKGDIYKLPGATAAQSSLFQALDVILGISHSNNPGRAQFVQEMRRSMPGYHVRFLEDIKSLPSISQFVEQAPLNSGLRQAYNKAVQALTEFRSEHVSIVTSFVLLPSKKSANPKERDDSAPKQGSGGSSDLFALLKGMRDDTKNSALKLE